MELRCCSLMKTLFYFYMCVHIAVAESTDNSTDVHEASVEQVPNPTMTIENGDLSDYRLPGYYTFNNGKPFYLEKDPLTGAIDFNKDSPIAGYAGAPEFTSASKQDRVIGQDKTDATDSEYYEDDDVSTTDQDFKEDGIDRKDGNIDGYRPNDIDKNPFKISSDLHQFLNLPVHYSSSDKFPLISSSYANTKIQGTGSSSNGGYSNHKYSTTSSTQSPSYYTFKIVTSTTARPTTVTSTGFPPSPPQFLTTPKPKITSKPSTLLTRITTAPTTSFTTTTTKSTFVEYNGEDLVYSDYDMDYSQPQASYPHNSHSESVSTTTKKAPVTVFKPTVIPINEDYTTKKLVQNITETEDEYEEDVSIVTSLPVDVYYSQQTQPTTLKTTLTSTVSTTTTPKPTTTTTTTERIKETTAPYPVTTEVFTKSTTPLTTTLAPTTLTTKYSTVYNEFFKPTPPSNYHFYGTKDSFEPIVDEPFRPIFGPHDSSSQPSVSRKPQPVYNEVKPTPNSHAKPYFEYHSPSNAKPLPNHGKIEFVERVPIAEQTNKYAQKPVNAPPKFPGVEPPRPNPPIVFSSHGLDEHSSEQYNKRPVIPSQNNPLLYNNNEKQNLNGNPVRVQPHESVNYGRPQGSSIQGQILPDPGSPVRQTPPNQRPFIRLPDDVPFYVKKHSNGTVTKIPKPEEIIYPQQRPVGVIPPSGLKPDSKPTDQVVKFHPPMKNENHFIKVPLNEENPSYSLQTSFSIGLSGDGPGDKDNKKTGQGVGQVLFPDGSIDTSLQTDKDKPIQGSPIRNRPTNTRPYITSYNQNNHPQQPPPLRPQQPSIPSQVLPQRNPSQRLPGPEFRPPKPNSENYPRPHWENHSKPHIIFNTHHNSGSKPEIPPSFPSINKIKPDSSVQRPDLPNILPQFRPNAKVGSNEFSVNLGNNERLREPMDILQPPPLPQPQHLRVNRNDDSGIAEEIEKSFEDNDATQPPLVHRRTGPQPVNNRVTTLQMMQQGPPRRNLIRNDYHDNRPEKPVYLVYPANAGSKQQMQTQSSEGVVVVGTRGPHQPVPPSNLKTTVIEKEEDSDIFPLDDEKHFSISTRDRVDTPVLKIKTQNKPALKNDFPYEILKPQENVLPEERIMAGANVNTPAKEYNAFSPTVSSSTEDIKDPDAEINLIPYLQDYMPFATKKPMTLKANSAQMLHNEKNPDFIKLSPGNKPISVTLNTKLVTTGKPEISPEHIKNQKPMLLTSHENPTFNVNNGGSEHTVGAVMHMNYANKPTNHRPFEVPPSSNQPKPVDLEAPFQASLSAPESQGWTVVKSNSDKRNQEIDRQDEDSQNEEKQAEQSDTKFDFDNFKPQLFGGFKPIIPSSDEKSDNKSKENGQDKTTSRQEKTYR